MEQQPGKPRIRLPWRRMVCGEVPDWQSIEL